MLPPFARIPPELSALADYEAAARPRLSDMAREYFDGAAADGVTARENRAAYDRLRLRGRVLADFTGGGHTRVKLLGRERAHPILFAPVGHLRLAHPEGELAVAAAAAASDTIQVVSTMAGFPLAEIANAAPGAARWFQLYLRAERAATLELVRRAEAAGFEALVLTADAPVTGPRDGGAAARFRAPEGGAANLAGLPGESADRRGEGLCGGLAARAPTWADLAWLVANTRLPVLLKGVMDAADAVRALDAGAAGVIVSNHGGRTLDTLPATIDVLPEVVAAVGGRGPVLIDGGVRRGTDVLKALALGASAVLIGRPVVHGLAAAGAPGVAHVARLLRAELEIAMTLTGRPTVADIDRSAIWTPAARTGDL